MPDRIQLSRAKGWRMPEGAVKVDRTTIWGNPFMVGQRVQVDPNGPIAVCFSQAEAVEAYRDLIMTPMMAEFRTKAIAHLRDLGHGPVRWDPPNAVVKAIVGGPATDQDFGLQLNGRKIVGHLKFVWKTLPFSMRVGAWT